MKIKITGKSPELFEHYLTAVLNLAAVAAMGGHIPDKREIEDPQRFGRYWYREKEGATLDRFNLYPFSNDYFAAVIDEAKIILYSILRIGVTVRAAALLLRRYAICWKSVFWVTFQLLRND